jgi:hypothetical protein
MRRSELSQRLVGFALLTMALGACQAIAGIEERKLDPDAESAQTNSKQCKDYCTTVMANCTGKNAVYTKEELCLGVCATLDPGDPNEPQGNTVACRARQADLATEEPSVNCIAAGPGGNGICGTDCEAYCQIFPKICKDEYEYTSDKACLQACSGLIEQPDRFDVTKDHSGDTIECRLVHVSSATVEPTPHCSHAPIRPSEPWCTDAADAAPTCEQYCKVELAACAGDLAQYESPEQCMAACNALDRGTNADQTGNTVGCRRYHSFNSTLLPATHCFHSGPSGDGHCGDHDTGNCDAYCTLLAAACPDEFQTSMGSPDECVAACTKLPEAAGNSLYTVAKAKQSKGFQCRILHAVQALQDKTACASAIGGDQCQ